MTTERFALSIQLSHESSVFESRRMIRLFNFTTGNLLDVQVKHCGVVIFNFLRFQSFRLCRMSFMKE